MQGVALLYIIMPLTGLIKQLRNKIICGPMLAIHLKIIKILVCQHSHKLSSGKFV
jgi:hypothetical protein